MGTFAQAALGSFFGTIAAYYALGFLKEIRRKPEPPKPKVTAGEILKRQGPPVAALLALLIAGVAGATTHYVNHALGTDSGAGTSPGASAWKTIGYANSHLAAGDVLLIAPSDTVYDASINPTVQQVTFIGDSVAYEKITVPGINVKKFNCSFIGMRVSGGITTSTTQFSSNGRYEQFRDIHAVGGMLIQSGMSTISNCKIGSTPDSAAASWSITPVFDHCDSLSIFGNTSFCYNANAASLFQPMDWEPTCQEGDANKWRMQFWSVHDNTLKVRQIFGQQLTKGFMFRRIANSSIINNAITFEDSSGIAFNGSCWQAFVMRDSCTGDSLDGNTITLTSKVPGTGNAAVFIYSSGNNVVNHGNCFRNMIVKSDLTDMFGVGMWNNQRHMAGLDRMYNCTLVNNGSNPAFWLTGSDEAYPSDSVWIQKCTFANLAGGEAIRIERATTQSACLWGGTLSMHSNIFYTTRAGGSQAGDVPYEIGTPAGAAGLVDSDNNLFFNGANAIAVRGGACGLAHSSFTLPAWCTFSQHECASHFGSPHFNDSTFATFDGHLRSDSKAIGAGASGIDCGAYPYVGDAVPPAPVTDLTLAGVGDSYCTLTWTATGDDGLTGTATSYDLRYSTSPITAGNFSLATNFATNAPQASGVMESIQVTGLSPGTTYYFAIIVKDEVPNASAISNVQNGTTRKVGTLGHLNE